jgi:hypothetical protein
MVIFVYVFSTQKCSLRNGKGYQKVYALEAPCIYFTAVFEFRAVVTEKGKIVIPLPHWFRLEKLISRTKCNILWSLS